MLLKIWDLNLLQQLLPPQDSTRRGLAAVRRSPKLLDAQLPQRTGSKESWFIEPVNHGSTFLQRTCIQHR